jgi:hypothetical protein
MRSFLLGFLARLIAVALAKIHIAISHRQLKGIQSGAEVAGQ